MILTHRRLDKTPSRFTQCSMLSSSVLIPSLQRAAQHLHAELTTLHPHRTVRMDSLVNLLDAVAVQTVNLLVRAATAHEVVVDHTGEDILVALHSAGQAHAVSIRDLTRALIYTTPGGEELHLAFEEHLLNGDDAVDVLLRLGTTPAWSELLSSSTTRAARVFSLMVQGGLDLRTAELYVLQDAADLTRCSQIAFDARRGRVIALAPSARHSA